MNTNKELMLNTMEVLKDSLDQPLSAQLKERVGRISLHFHNNSTYSSSLRCVCTLSCFSHHFTKGSRFWTFSRPDTKVRPKWVLLLKDIICFRGWGGGGGQVFAFMKIESEVKMQIICKLLLDMYHLIISLVVSKLDFTAR